MSSTTKLLDAAHSGLANALIGATPEDWKSALLDVVPAPDIEAADCTISNPDDYEEEVEATDELVSAIRDLRAALRDSGDPPFSRMRFIIENGPDDWRFRVAYEYPD